MKTDSEAVDQDTQEVEVQKAPRNNVKQSQNASSKVSYVVKKVLLPLTVAPIGDRVSFKCRHEDDMGKSFVEELMAMKSESIADKERFVQTMSDLYERHVGSK